LSVLYERAIGYNYEAVKIFMPANREKPVIVPYIEHVPPDVTACIFWLKNRDPQHWRDSQELEHVLGKYIISGKPMQIPTQALHRRNRSPEPLTGNRADLGHNACADLDVVELLHILFRQCLEKGRRRDGQVGNCGLGRPGRPRPHIGERQAGKTAGLGKEHLHDCTQPLFRWMKHTL
jgi:hypothetical protein